MRIVSFGNLYIDYYFKNDELVGIMGGKTDANIIANLSKYYDTLFIGIVGNDKQGDICIESLDKLGVDVSHIRRVDTPTKKLFINEGDTSMICPCCNRNPNCDDIPLNEEEVLPFINKDDVIVVDNTKDSTLNIIDKLDNKKFLDLGYVGGLRFLSLDEIIEKIADKFKIISMNERVYKFFKSKFDIDSMDLYEYLKCEILIITRGKRGADIIFNDEFIKKEIEVPSVEVDSNGAGDSFFSEFIHVYLESDVVDLKMISLAYLKASSISSYVVTLLGSRSHLLPLVKINDYKECICQDIECHPLN